MTAAFLEGNALRKTFQTARGLIAAVDDVTLAVRRGETLAIVGQSGSGKSTLGKLLLGLEATTEGTVKVDGVDLGALGPAALRTLRRRMQPVFQDPGEALDPRLTVRQAVEEPLIIHGLGSTAERADRVARALDFTGLSPALGERRPHELSGGQRQRAGIARALVLEPEVLVADEPISSLDVSIQAQVVNLLIALQQQRHTAIVFIAHDLRVVAQFAHRVAVMAQGKIVEEGTARDVLERPTHPHTRALLAAVPRG